eukprot:363441-Chlamydomonas_euryale.AAC.5
MEQRDDSTRAWGVEPSPAGRRVNRRVAPTPSCSTLAHLSFSYCRFLVGLLQRFPDLADRPLWLSGESYAGTSRLNADQIARCVGKFKMQDVCPPAPNPYPRKHEKRRPTFARQHPAAGPHLRLPRPGCFQGAGRCGPATEREFAGAEPAGEA